MSAKKSLGHFPPEYFTSDESEFYFIPEAGTLKAEREAASQEDVYISVGKVKVKKTAGYHDINSGSDNGSSASGLQYRESPLISEKKTPLKMKKLQVKKSVASYYLEDTLIKRLKNYARSSEKSYSSVVSKSLKRFLSGNS